MAKKYKTAKEILGKRNVWDLEFNELLIIVDSLFPTTKKARLSSYNYTIGRFPYGWTFNVVSNWYKWSESGYQHQFGAYNSPALALAAFLEYIIKNNIEPHTLHKD